MSVNTSTNVNTAATVADVARTNTANTSHTHRPPPSTTTTTAAAAASSRPKPPIAEKPAVPTKPAFIPPPMRPKCTAHSDMSKANIVNAHPEHRRIPSTGLKSVHKKIQAMPTTSAPSTQHHHPPHPHQATAVSPPQIRAANNSHGASAGHGNNGCGTGAATALMMPVHHHAAHHHIIQHQRGRTPSNASNDGNGSDYDRTSYQLEAIKQKSLDLDRRWPAHLNDEHYGVFSRSASADDKPGAAGPSGPASATAAVTTSAAYQHHNQHQRVPNKIFQQSSKQLEQILAQRIEKEAGMQRKGSGGGGGALANAMRRASVTTSNAAGVEGNNGSGGVSGVGTADANAVAGASKPMDMAKLLNAEMKLHCKSIQEKHLIERRPPQQAYRPVVGVKTGEPPMSSSWFEPGSGVKFNKASTSFDSNASAHIWSSNADKLPAPLKHELLGHMRKGSSVSTKTIDMDDAAVEATQSGSAAAAGNGSLDDMTLIYRDGLLISGSLDALIRHMVPTDDYQPDKQYAFAFLLSARLFVRPHQLLERICQISDAQRPDAAAPPADGAVPYATHFVSLLVQWVDDFPYDFRDERLMQHVRRMTQKCIQLDPAGCRRAVSAMLQTLLNRLTVLDQYEMYLNRVNGGGGGGVASSSSSGGDANGSLRGSAAIAASASAATAMDAPHCGPGQVVDITELCTGPLQLAHQLTHIELERLSHIGAEEFVQAFAKENLLVLPGAGGGGGAESHSQPKAPASAAAASSTADIKKTRNLESYVQWFNRLSYLVASEIVKYSKKKQRVRIIEYWIETALESFNIGNFNSLMAIIAGLNMSPISRLKKTWAKVQSAKFMVLEHQMDPTSNFHSYRSTLKAAMWRSAGATDERQRIVIPFFSLLVKDLYFLNEGCSNRLANGYINFEKFWQLAKQVNEFIGWKQVQCTFERNSSITWQLQTSTILSETELAWWSFECEPPDSAVEKERYKALKVEMTHHQHQHTSGQH